MDEDTTTATTDVQTGAEEAQPVTDVDTTAADAQTTTEPGEESQDVEAVETPADAPQVDDKLQKYAQSQGLDLDSPSAIKAATIAMKAQSEATRNYHKTTELEKTLTATSDEVAEVVAEQRGVTDPLVLDMLKRDQRREVKDSIRDFWDANPTARDYESKMIELLQTKPHLAGDLESLYATAVMQSGKLDSVKSQGKREALESLAHKQQAAVPTGNATNRSMTPKEKPFKDLSIAEMEAKLGTVR